VKPTVQFALTPLTGEEGLKETPEMTELKLSPLAGFEATVSVLVETLKAVFAPVPAARLVILVIATEIALDFPAATGVAIVTVPAAVVGVAVAVVPFTL